MNEFHDVYDEHGGHAHSSNSEIEHLRSEIHDLGEWKRRLSHLLEFSKRASSETNLDRLLQLVVDETKVILLADRCTVFLYDRQTNELWSRIAHGDGIGTIRFPSRMGLAGHVAQTGETINLEDAYKDSRFNQEMDRRTGYRTKAVLAVPMRNLKGDIIGVFQVLNRPDGHFTKDDEEILSLLGAQAAIAIENAQLAENLKKATQSTIFRLSVAAEYKDQDTAAHLKKMSAYSSIIAEEYGLSADRVQMIQMAAPMHDIGKLGVADAILHKPGKLTPEEFADMKQHPIFGAKILENAESDLLRLSRTITLHHHEKWDGTGYPHGLKGEAISLEGRICALGDVFDALTSKRPYKAAFSLEETLRIVKEGAGKHFDPKAVEALLKGVDRIKVVMTRYAEEKAAEDPSWGTSMLKGGSAA